MRGLISFSSTVSNTVPGVVVWYPRCWILDAARRGAGSPQVSTRPAREDSFLNNLLCFQLIVKPGFNRV